MGVLVVASDVVAVSVDCCCTFIKDTDGCVDAASDSTAIEDVGDDDDAFTVVAVVVVVGLMLAAAKTSNDGDTAFSVVFVVDDDVGVVVVVVVVAIFDDLGLFQSPKRLQAFFHLH